MNRLTITGTIISPAIAHCWLYEWHPQTISDILHSPCFPHPWDDAEDHVDLFVWLGAIETGDMRLLARYLRNCSACDKRVLRALADKLDPPTKTASRYVWKRNRGRPLNRLEGTRGSRGNSAG